MLDPQLQEIVKLLHFAKEEAWIKRVHYIKIIIKLWKVYKDMHTYSNYYCIHKVLLCTQFSQWLQLFEDIEMVLILLRK